MPEQKPRTFTKAANIVLFVLFLISVVNLVILLVGSLPVLIIDLAKAGTYEWEAIAIIYLFVFGWKHRVKKKTMPVQYYD